MRRVGPALVACVLMLAGCSSASVVGGQVSSGRGCGPVSAGGNAAVFFVIPGGTANIACGYTYAGKPTGRLIPSPECLEICEQPSPDGDYTLSGIRVTDTASGRVVARVPNLGIGGYVWASDSRHLCGVHLGRGTPAGDVVHLGPVAGVVLVIAGLGGQVEQVTLAPLFSKVRGEIGLVMCNPQDARAVLETIYAGVTAVAVVSLSDGAVLAEHDFPNTSGRSPGRSTLVAAEVIASADGRYLAVQYSIQSPSGPESPAYVDLFDVDHPDRPIARLAGVRAEAFSGDGTLLTEQMPRTHGSPVTRVVRWSDGKLIWQSNEGAVAVSSPGVPVIAMETSRPGRPANQIIILVRPDGQSIPVTNGVLAEN